MLCTHPLREVEGCDAQRPETAEHGEDGQAQVITRRNDNEVIFTLAVAGAVRLWRDAEHTDDVFLHHTEQSTC